MTTVSPEASATPRGSESALSYSEFWESGDVPRAHQRLLADRLLRLPPAEIERLRRLVRRRIMEHEVTFNILGVPEGANRPWDLDLIPLVVDNREWEALSYGLKQRATLWEAFLDDCYGQRRMVAEGIVPAHVVLGNPEFLRPCHGWLPLGGHRLWLYGVDLGREPSGAFRVFSDRATAPTGAGYALENRLVVGQTLGDLFREYGVEKLRVFFGKVRESVTRLAPHRGAEPRTVLLTSGPQDESSFEHGYLARYWGFELVEGRDLTVRNGEVFLKTLSGLSRVDVVMRRVSDVLCDPLELREDSTLGVAGLVQAARRGNVGLANPLGAGLVEVPALRPYLPALSKALLGEELSLPSIETLWCGEPRSLDQVLGASDSFIIKPAFSERRGDAVRLSEMARHDREELLARVRALPHNFVAEKWPELSTAPLISEAGRSSGTVAMRTFLCRDGDGFDVMPGGLVRVNAAPDGIFLSRRLRRASKDLWVAAAEPKEEHSLPEMPDQRVELRRGGMDLPSRLLDDLYWLGRYVERCDGASRLVRAGLERTGLDGAETSRPVLAAILRSIQEIGYLPTGLNLRAALANAKSRTAELLLLGVLVESGPETNLLATLRRIHRLTLSVRSRLSRDAWHVLRRLSQLLDGTSLEKGTSRVADAMEIIDELLVTLAAVSGTSLDNMVRGHAWVFLDMGRRVERGGFTLHLVDHLLPPGATRAHMEALLEIADSLLTYRARYLSKLQATPVLDLLLTDDTNPRSLVFQVATLLGHLAQLPRQGPARSRAERRLITLHAQLLTADVEQAASGDGSGLRALVEDCSNLLWQLSDDVTSTWFSHAARSRALAPPAWIDEELEGR